MTSQHNPRPRFTTVLERTCIDCHVALAPPVKPGRPPSYCPSCSQTRQRKRRAAQSSRHRKRHPEVARASYQRWRLKYLDRERSKDRARYHASKQQVSE